MIPKKLVGYKNFLRSNQLTDKFPIDSFSHVEIYCQDAINAAKRFSSALGMQLVEKSDYTTGNNTFTSHVIQSNDFVLIFTSPSNNRMINTSAIPLLPFYSSKANDFIEDHGLGVKAIGIRVADATAAYQMCVANGAISVTKPYETIDDKTSTNQMISEIQLVGDVVIRWISGTYKGISLINYTPVEVPKDSCNLGILRLDHAVSNVPDLFPVIEYLMTAIGFHEFSEFTTEDVGTVDSGLNSMVLANNNEYVLLPINEPTHGTKRKSQIQTYLDYNNGPGIQHMALLTKDIFYTVREMKKRSIQYGGFDFMPSPSSDYYRKIPIRIGENILSESELLELEELGLLIDKDDQGVLIQIFTKPVTDRPTLFFEIIQRIGCEVDKHGQPQEQTGGCGGFGKGNFSELFKSIETFERQFE